MKCLALVTALTILISASGCATRVAHDQSEESGSSQTVVELAPLDSPPPLAAEPQRRAFDLDGIGNVMVIGNVHHHDHLHVHEAPEPTTMQVDVRVRVDALDERERRQRIVEERINGLLSRR